MPDPLVLTMSAFLTLASQCGDGVAPATLADLQAHESGFNTIAININGPNGGTVKNIKTKIQAIALAKTLYAKGVSFDAGVPQINSQNFELLGLTPETVFDPCQAIRAQSRLLRLFSQYNTGDKQRGFDNGYVNKVLAQQPRVREAMRQAWQAETRPAAPPAPPPAGPPADPPPSPPPSDPAPPAEPPPRTGPRKLIVPEYP